MSAGYRPLFAHPERCRFLTDREYAQMHEAGVLFQLNLGSLTGYYGNSVKKNAEFLLAKGWYSAFGSDCHRLRTIKEQYEIKAKGVSTPMTAYEVTGISGQYKIKLTSNRDYNVFVPKENIYIELYSIKDKKLSDAGIKGITKAMADKRIIFECDSPQEINNHSDWITSTKYLVNPVCC